MTFKELGFRGAYHKFLAIEMKDAINMYVRIFCALIKRTV